MLSRLAPSLVPGEYVFCTLEKGGWQACAGLEPWAACVEEEGLAVVLERSRAEAGGMVFEGVFRRISLGVHSSLQAVGLTAEVSQELAGRGISANVVAGRYHDHFLVPAERAEEALSALKSLVESVAEEGG